MEKQKVKVGEIRPIYNITGFQICKTTSEDPEKVEWIPTEKISEAEILSFIFQSKREIPTKKLGRPKKILEKEEITNDSKEITDEDL